jgi:hypothetical protein
VSLLKEDEKGWGCDSQVQHLPSTCKTMDSTPGTERERKRERERERERNRETEREIENTAPPAT